VDPNVPPDQIQIRKSQMKFDSEHFAIEICRSSFFSPGYLNRQIITLLETLGISKETFIQIKDEIVQDLSFMLNNPNDAMKVLRQYEDSYGFSNMVIQLIQAGFFELKDPYLMNLLRVFYATQVTY
jgi:hypothetical protein